MDALLILRNIKVENANTIAGLTWGFPAISNFLGFVHALSRKLPAELKLKLDGCGVISHNRQILSHQPRGWGDHVFALTRNPLTKEEKSPAFNEEGRMHMTVSLLIPIAGILDDSSEPKMLGQVIEQLALSLRLAGGTIINIGAVEILEPPEDYEELQLFYRKQLRKLLPGFALVQCSDLLAEHTGRCVTQDSHAEPLDAWLDFSAIKFQAELPDGVVDEQTPAEWRYVPKPDCGWLVPMATGYRGISDLYESGQVARSRDSTTPFRFVESVYSVGEWISPHRTTDLKQLIWCYHSEPETGWYMCRNSYQPKPKASYAV
ncbi:MAG: type I-F CRISPR-associated protein Csy2 [Oryzomonas sp.]|uniref:type I-F CRISPR-associated protein Csy2 n=1 Tax=Oryzomonas sp. TaxID=2855186 RepID=UPI00284F1D23|nr:type I-F CRISPR-associated protein Csy2 [Oryzomonas sp.]MDR3578831.1 type I-F CRISPR-associated protein Csy2 [Oryzomonas sp.]